MRLSAVARKRSTARMAAAVLRFAAAPSPGIEVIWSR